MPFDDDDQNPSPQSQKVGLKKVSSQPSIFDSMPKKPTQADLEQKVQKMEQRSSSLKAQTADLALRFNKAMVDKTLPQNKNVFQQEVELDLLRSMIKLGQEINNDPDELEADGSICWIAVLLKTCFNQRDRLNLLEYRLSQLENKSATPPPLDKPPTNG